jgi:hypothetical protein
MLKRKGSWWAGYIMIFLVITPAAFAAIFTTGSVWPNPIPADGVVTGELQVGVTFQSVGQVDVTEPNSLTTQQRTFLGYTVAANGTVNIINTTWTSNAVFVAGQAFTTGNVALTNSLWDVNSNVSIASGDNSVGTVTLNGGSSWDQLFGTKIAEGEDCQGQVILNDGTWTAHAKVTAGGDRFNPSPGVGTIEINPAGVMLAEYGVEIRAHSGIAMCGGFLLLAGDSTFEGTLGFDPNVCDPNNQLARGGTLLLNVGLVAGGTGLVTLGSGVDFDEIDVAIVFHPDVIPDPNLVYDVFDLDEPNAPQDLATLLAGADSLCTPVDWILNHDTGEMRFISIIDALTGPDHTASAARQAAFDTDADEDVDLADLYVHQAAMGRS